MPKFLSMFSYTPESLKRMMENPQSRLPAVTKAVESIGGKLESFYLVLGPFDGILVAELPDASAAAVLASTVIATGAVKTYESFPLLSADEGAAVMKRAQILASTYKPPGK